MKKSTKSRLAYTIALAAMATTFASLQALADDDMTTTAPTTNSVATPQPAPMPTTAPASPGAPKILGTLPTSEATPDSSTPSSASPAVASPAVPSTIAARPAEVPPVAPLPMPDSSAGVLPQQKSGDITYITGGIGDEERAALGEAKKDYNLYIMSSNKDGSFVGDTHVVIHSGKNDEVLNTSAGPLLYVKLPAGVYTVEETKGTQTKKEKITIGTKGASNIQFSW